MENTYEQLQIYKMITDSVSDIVFLLRKDGSIIDVNEVAIEAYGYSRQELISMSITDVQEKNQNKKIGKQMKIAGKKSVLFETVHYRKDGSCFPAEVLWRSAKINNKNYIINVITDISEKIKSQRTMQYFASYDYLTGIPNRYLLEQYMQMLFSQKAGSEHTLLFLDIDNFKMVNDSFGYVVGDSVIVDFANFIKGLLRPKDLLARIGGDEFAIVLHKMDINKAKEMAKDIIKAVKRHDFLASGEETEIKLTVSIGVITIDNAVNIQEVFSQADLAVFAAKEQGKNRVVIVEKEQDDNHLIHIKHTVLSINSALKKNMFQLHLQPVHHYKDGILYYEALLRMISEDNQLIYPGSFMPTAERFGLMPQIDYWVISSTIGHLQDYPDATIFVNIAGSSLGDEDLLNDIEKLILESAINPARLGFEITETTAVKDIVRAKHWIDRLKTMGCRFALDDFGVGFSSFAYLHLLPVDYLKIDGSFVRDLDKDIKNQALVLAMNAVAHALGKLTIAECVGNDRVMKVLRDLNTDYGQGFHLGKPAALHDVLIKRLAEG